MKTSLMAGRALTVAIAAGALALAACSSGESSGDAAAAPTTGVPAPTTAPADSPAPFGPGCASLPASGPGSAEAIADQPVATAASQNPQLSTLVSAVTAAGLADTLNQADGITVFAPTNDAFAKIPEDTLKSVLADKKALTDILTYHVVAERRTSADLGAGSFTTLQGDTITTAASGDTYTANDARIVCGNLTTSNAVVHVIDTVLMPKN
jgi:uncharacterized surface protein with fasciclin (FAS1) repeats